MLEHGTCVYLLVIAIYSSRSHINLASIKLVIKTDRAKRGRFSPVIPIRKLSVFISVYLSIFVFFLPTQNPRTDLAPTSNKALKKYPLASPFPSSSARSHRDRQQFESHRARDRQKDWRKQCFSLELSRTLPNLIIPIVSLAVRRSSTIALQSSELSASSAAAPSQPSLTGWAALSPSAASSFFRGTEIKSLNWNHLENF